MLSLPKMVSTPNMHTSPGDTIFGLKTTTDTPIRINNHPNLLMRDISVPSNAKAQAPPPEAELWLQ
jgi:hypothetical protein